MTTDSIMGNQMIVPKLPTEAYAIYNPITEMWSRGGSGPKWGKKPKLWSSIGHLKNHLNLMVYPRYRHGSTPEIVVLTVYDSCYIFDVAKQEQSTLLIADVIQSHVNRNYLSKPYYKDAKVVQL